MNLDLPDDVFLSDQPRRYRELLLAWFDLNRRSLPWRRHRSLYGTWISEMMLQQTTVATVIPYWEKFLATWPDVESLASASVEEVLSRWSGLGYYRRARHLHAAARQVASERSGCLPEDLEGWLALPGIGPYAGGAIASIGLGQRVPALDANAKRVLLRWLVATPESQDRCKPAHLQRVGAELVDPQRPGDWNEAVMELGALVCRAVDPLCGDCPVQALCRAGSGGTADRIPVPGPKLKPVGVRLGLLAVMWRDQVLLVPPGRGPVATWPDFPEPVRPDVSGLHHGLWGLPATPWLPLGGSRAPELPTKIWEPFLRDLAKPGLVAGTPTPLSAGSFRHAVTRYRLLVQVHVLRLPNEMVHPGELSCPDGAISGPCFCGIPDPARPVSSLVNKSLAVVRKSSV